ncbi:MAG: ABC transporter permease [Chloroflexales bacterium]|nr:ABC transporter permease [Chloroflexales bacterium]
MELLRLLNDAYAYFLDHRSEFGKNLATHLGLSGGALAVALVLCVPLGIFVARRQRLAPAVINIVGTLRVIPSLAVLFLALPYLGIGAAPALVALSILACPPVLLNTYAGFRGVDRAVIEAAQGMGMTPGQVLRQVEWPLALPVVIAGVRTAAVEVVASATLAAYIAAGGLGDYIQRGFNTGNNAVLLLGAVPVALLALSIEALLSLAQRWASPTS